MQITMPTLLIAGIIPISGAPGGSRRSSVSSNKAAIYDSNRDLPRPSSQLALPIDESALDTEDALPPLPLPPTTPVRIKRPSEVREAGAASGGTYELHPLPSYFSERSRRPSALKRADSDPNTLTSVSTKYYDGALTPAEITTPTVEDNRTISSTAPIVHSVPGELDMAISARQRMTGRIQFATTCWCFFLQGWNDGSTGPLLPVIQREHGVGFAVVSLLFVFNCLVRQALLPEDLSLSRHDG